MVNKPVSKVRDGVLEIAVWENEREKDGKKYNTYSFTASRMYVDRNNEAKNTASFREADALKMAELWREAYKAVKEVKKADSPRTEQIQIDEV